MTRELGTALFAGAALLALMLCIVTGHVRSVMRDWSDANYSAGDASWTVAAIPNPDGAAPAEERAARVNAGLRAALRGSDVSVVLDALDGDGPRVGLYDPSGRFSTLRMVEGRGLQPPDFESNGTRVVVSADSYLVGRLRTYVPDGLEVVGYFDAASAPFRSEYVYTLFGQENVHGTYYLRGADSRLVGRFVEALTSEGYLVDVQRLDPSAWAIIRGEPLTYAYAAGLILGYAGVLLLVAGWAGGNRRRYRILQRYGAHSASFSAGASDWRRPSSRLAALSAP